ncbi:MAG: glycosyl transferase family 2 [Streptosporangiaceae bacterium]|jgi:glycosyltransferase involved in cell wall biosynthesis|nr:glycosyl transferase family 2 [Streptosporangiaceae bacterium]
MRMRTLVVIPALNEELALPGVLAELADQCPYADVLVVDDGSTDGTVAVARQQGIPVVRLPFNLGVGGAMRTGYRYAVQQGYDVVVQVDADGQHDASYLQVLLDALGEADLVIGARFAGEGVYTAARGPRRWAMRLLAAVLSGLAHTQLTDATSGFRAAGPRAVRVFAEHYPAEYLGDTVESVVIALRSGCTVRQVPVAMRPRTVGQASQNPLRASVYLLRAIMALGLALVRRWTPVDPK